MKSTVDTVLSARRIERIKFDAVEQISIANARCLLNYLYWHKFLLKLKNEVSLLQYYGYERSQ
jgi:hypothetical protein